MICKSCGKKMEYTERGYAPDTFDCECGEWIEAQMAFNEMKARAEKAESELKAIKARIEALSEAQPKYLHLSSDNTDWEASFYGLRNEIKQMGGEK